MSPDFAAEKISISPDTLSPLFLLQAIVNEIMAPQIIKHFKTQMYIFIIFPLKSM
jgi:hypothetical protein